MSKMGKWKRLEARQWKKQVDAEGQSETKKQLPDLLSPDAEMISLILCRKGLGKVADTSREWLAKNEKEHKAVNLNLGCAE